MKITVNNQTGAPISYTLVAFVVEDVVTEGIINKTERKAVVYCFDKARLPFKFLASQIERYD